MIGETIGNHRIVRQLGLGGMGEVFLAEHHQLRTQVAIKFLLPHVSVNEACVKRFFNEAIAASKIAHAGIVKVFDSGYHAGRAYLVMERLRGETLASRLQRVGRLTLPQISDLGRQISSALEATHKAGITHRDLKPDNIFIVPDDELASGERVKILDFGIAKLTGTFSGATSTGMGGVGTPAYMAPEQWMDAAKVDWRADIYSLGCLVFEMACGRPPFIASSFGEACTQHLGMKPPRIQDLVPGLPDPLSALISQMLAKAPEARPSSLREIARIFTQLGAPQPGPLAPAPPVGEAAAQARGPQPELVHHIAHAPASPPINRASVGLAAQRDAHLSRRMTVLVMAVLLGVIGLLGATVAILMTNRSDTTSKVAAVVEDAGARGSAPPSAPDVAAPGPSGGAGSAETGVVAKAPEPRAKSPDLPREDTAREDTAAPGAAVKEDTKGGGAGGTAPPAAPSDKVTDLNKASCALKNYEGKLCQKYRKSPPARPAEASGGAGSVSAELPETLDREMISEGVVKVRALVLACGGKLSAKGMVKLSVKVSPDGVVTNVIVTTTPEETLGACAAGAMRRATFRKTLRGGSFGYPFLF